MNRSKLVYNAAALAVSVAVAGFAFYVYSDVFFAVLLLTLSLTSLLGLVVYITSEHGYSLSIVWKLLYAAVITLLISAPRLTTLLPEQDMWVQIALFVGALTSGVAVGIAMSERLGSQSDR